MGFAPVKTSPYGPPKQPQNTPLWPDSKWRKLVQSALMEMREFDRRIKIASLCSFKFKRCELTTLDLTAIDQQNHK